MVYLDNAATTFPKPETVYTFMDKFYREFGVNVGRGQHKLADKASSLVAETRQLLLGMFKCSNKEVVFTPSATEALNIILQGLTWKDNMTVYITPFEHNAVMRVLYHISSLHKLNIVELAVDKTTFTYDLEKIEYQFQSTKPDVVVMSHASNVCGLIAPIKEICDLSKKHGAINVIDMAQTAGLIDTDLSSIQTDFAVFAGHKTLYAPFGAAGFVCDKNPPIVPLLYGGTGVDSASRVLPNDLPERFEIGSINVAAIAGLNAALKWIDDVSISAIYEREKLLTEEIIEISRRYKNVKVVGRGNGDHIGVISLVFDGYASDAIGQVLSDRDIAVRTGLHCAPDAHQFLGTFPNGTVRISVGYFNKINKLEEAFEYINANN